MKIHINIGQYIIITVSVCSVLVAPFGASVSPPPPSLFYLCLYFFIPRTLLYISHPHTHNTTHTAILCVRAYICVCERERCDICHTPPPPSPPPAYSSPHLHLRCRRWGLIGKDLHHSVHTRPQPLHIIPRLIFPHRAPLQYTYIFSDSQLLVHTHPTPPGAYRLFEDTSSLAS